MKVSFSSAHRKDPEVRDGVRIPYAASKRSKAKFLWWSIIFVVFLPFAVLLWHIFAGWFFIYSPGAISMESYTVRAPEDGLLAEIKAVKGAQVASGATLAVLKRVDSPKRLEQIAMMKAELESLTSPAPAPRYARPGVSIKLIDENIAYFSKEAEKMRSLMAAGAATKADVDEAEARLRSAKTERAAALAGQPGDPDGAAVKKRILYLSKSISYLEGISGTLVEVKAPRGGRVQYVDTVAGQSISAGDELLSLADPSTVCVIAYVAPEDFKGIKPGVSATVIISGSERRVKAEVIEPPTTAQNMPNGLADGLISDKLSVKVYLKLKGPLLPEESVDGLPLKVSWGNRISR